MTTFSSSDPKGTEVSENPILLPSILELSREKLASAVVDMGEKTFRSTQLWRSLYRERVRSFDDISTLSKSFRQRLSGTYSISPLSELMFLTSSDSSTSKVLYRLNDG